MPIRCRCVAIAVFDTNTIKIMPIKGRYSLAKNISVQQIYASLPEAKNGEILLAKNIPNIIVETLEKANEPNLFSLFEFTDIPDENGKEVVMQTDLGRGARMPTIILRLNKKFFTGKTLNQINKILKQSDWSLADNIQEAIIHEIGHAKIIRMWKNSSFIREKQKELEKIKIDGISKVGYTDGNELLAESEIVLSRGGILPEEVKRLRRKYMG